MISSSSDRRRTVLLSGLNIDFMVRNPPNANGDRAVAGVVTRTLTSKGGILFISRGTTTLRIILGHLTSIKLSSFYLSLRSCGTGGGRVVSDVNDGLSLRRRCVSDSLVDRLATLFRSEAFLGTCTSRLRGRVRPLKLDICRMFNGLLGLSSTPSIRFAVSKLRGVAGRRCTSVVCYMSTFRGTLHGVKNPLDNGP